MRTRIAAGWVLAIVSMAASPLAVAVSPGAREPKKSASTVSVAKPVAAANKKASARAVARRASERSAPSAPSAPSDYSIRPEVVDYIDELVARERFDRAGLRRVFADARYSAAAARLMTPSASPSGAKRDWNAYRARFVEPVRLAAGYRFWDDNAALLERAEREFGVPAEIIVGILGVETVYGRNTGGFRVVDALTTLAFDYPDKQKDRSAFFREQLTDVLLLAREGGADIGALRGSYAGAIGMPQFMPGSIRRFAIDYDGDGRIDLVGSTADVIGSVANFLLRHGWVRGQPTYLPLSVRPDVGGDRAARIDAMVEAGSVPSLRYADLTAAGLSTQAAIVEPLALIDLPSGSDAAGHPQVGYLAGTANFHVITRYNRSYFYAFSVIELGSTIKALREVR